jgi:hypothetical protein
MVELKNCRIGHTGSGVQTGLYQQVRYIILHKWQCENPISVAGVVAKKSWTVAIWDED